MKIYRFVNKANRNKFLEIHADGYSHWTVKQYLYWPSTGVKNSTGDGCLHRWRKSNLTELLKDYEAAGLSAQN